MDPMALLDGFSPTALMVMLAGLAAASLARGYSGFGFSALLVASWSLVTNPAKAVALALVLEVTASIFQAYSVWKDIPWKRVGLLMTGAVIGTPAGVYLLANSDERLLRLGIAFFILVSAIALLAGFTFKSRATSASTAMVGVASGACNGAVAMGGLPVALFLTADGTSPRAIRAAVVAYFFLLDITGLIFLSREGLVGGETLGLAVLSLPVLLIGMWLGARQFLGASPEGFRRVTLGLLVLLAALGIIRALWS